MDPPMSDHVFAVDRECLPIPAWQRLGIRLRGNQRNREIEKEVTGDVWVHNAFRKSKRYPLFDGRIPWQRIFPATMTRISPNLANASHW